MKFFALLFAIVLPFVGHGSDCDGFHTVNLAALINPSKLATLGKRGANPRILKAVAMMEEARRNGCQVSIVASNAVAQAGYTNALLAQLTRDGLVRNHDIAAKLGVLNPAGLADMRKGQSPTIRLGPYAGDELAGEGLLFGACRLVGIMPTVSLSAASRVPAGRRGG
jgi:hypothetical protein